MASEQLPLRPMASPARSARIASPERPFVFSCGERLEDVRLVYETYGERDPRGDNVVLLFPVLTTSHHAAGLDGIGPEGTPFWREDCHRGWWDDFIGPGKALDTDRLQVVCASFLGGCYGSTGPWSTDPVTGRPYGARFPRVSVEDLVDAQVRLLDVLGVGRLHAAVGLSFGGLLAYDLAARYPQRVWRVVSVASGLRTDEVRRHSNLAQRLAIEWDPAFGAAGDAPDVPLRGLVLARLMALGDYVAPEALGPAATARR